jgi:glycosyltransferase involved in cell wall biosynthesis
MDSRTSGPVLTAIHAPEWGGLHGFVARSAARLAAEGWPLIVVTPSDPQADEASRRLAENHVDVVRIPLSRVRKTTNLATHAHYLSQFKKEIELISQLGSDRNAVICQAIGLHHFHMMGAAKRLGLPLVWQLHGLAVPFPLRALLSFGLARMPDAIMVNGENWKWRFPGLVAAKAPIIPFYAPVDAQTFASSKEKRTRAREIMGIGEDELLIGTVGNFGARKRHDVMVGAFSEVLEQVPNAKFRIFGQAISSNEKWYADNVLGDSRATRLVSTDKLVISSPPAPVSEILCGFDIFVLTSDNEGIPLVIAEAMSAGVPIVSTRVGAISDMATPNDVARFAKRGDVSGVAREIVALCGNPAERRKMGDRAVKEMMSKFTEDAVVSSHVSAYSAAIKRAKSKKRSV